MSLIKPDTNEKPPVQTCARVVLVDDHPILRRGLSPLISQDATFFVCGQFADADSALLGIPELKPDVAIVDLTLKNGDGLELIKTFKARHPSLFVLVLSMHDEMVFADRALRAGASGYVMKHEAPETLVAGLRQVLAGDIWLSDKMRELLLRRVPGKSTSVSGSQIGGLANREFEVFSLIGRGLAARQIAERLCRSVKTVETHRGSIMKKLGLKTSAGLAIRAIQTQERL
jgi:DNA-binding NarL/FixJ family response regulator